MSVVDGDVAKPASPMAGVALAQVDLHPDVIVPEEFATAATAVTSAGLQSIPNRMSCCAIGRMTAAVLTIIAPGLNMQRYNSGAPVAPRLRASRSSMGRMTRGSMRRD